jgi:ferredoxin
VRKIIFRGGAEESKGGDEDAAATLALAVKGGNGEEEEDADVAAALPHAVPSVGVPNVYCCGGERCLYCSGGVDKSKGGGGEEGKDGDAAFFLRTRWRPWERQARRRRGFTASGEVTEKLAAAQSGVGSVKSK